MADTTEAKDEIKKTWSNLEFEVDDKGDLKEVAPVAESPKDVESTAETSSEVTKAKLEDESEEIDRRKPTRNDRLRRQRDEARTQAQQLQAELAELRAAREADSKVVATTVSSQLDAFENAAKSRLTMASDAYKNAFKEQDADGATKANFELQRAMLDLNTVSAQKQRLKTAPVPKTNGNGQARYQGGIHPKAQDWLDVNGDLVDDPDTFSIIKTIDVNLQAAGSDPTSDNHYESLDKKLIKLGLKKGPEQKTAPSGPTNGTRGGNVSRGRVMATSDDMDSAKRLGITIQDYLKQKQGTVIDGYTQVVL